VDESSAGSISHSDYVEALIAEIALEPDFGRLDAINFGGGTPSRLTAQQLQSVVVALTDRFGVDENAELSLEVNPEDWTAEFGEGLAEAGFNRVSIGAQSFDPAVLGALGRLHTADMIAATVAGAKESGIGSVGLDLIFGHPAESTESWERSIRHAVNVGVDHISTYSLTVEPGTELSRQINGGEPAPDDDAQADRYERFEDVAGSAGFARYEISNHARSGHICRYNLATWAHAEYVAFGIGAHDHRWGTRSRNHRRPDRYMEAIEMGERPIIGVEQLTDAEQERDRLMVGLRLAAGTPLTDTAQRFVDSDAGRQFIDAAVVEVRDGRVIVTAPMLTDAVIREALSVSTPDC
jgi:oxygen-independent coproporphyrinogen-3 oxidase